VEINPNKERGVDNPLIAITDKVMRMFRSMVYLTMCVGYRRGATIPGISSFLRLWAPSERDMYHEGVIERVLFDLNQEGKVTQAGARWYVVGATR